MTRPAAVDALFAGHTLPKSKAALDEVREYIRGLERIKEAALKAAKEKPVGTVARSTGGWGMSWQPIETAPRNCVVLVTGFAHDDPTRGRWLAAAEFENGAWFGDNDGEVLYQPTHWMPVPPFPGDA